MIHRPGGRGAASPIVVFLCLVLLLGGIAGVVIWTGQMDGQPIPPAPVGSASPAPSDMTLTDEEAIARFKELDSRRITALEKRDIALLQSIFTSGSPAFDRGRRSIRNLIRSGVVVDDQWRLRKVRVLRNSPASIDLRVVGLSDARFYDESGTEVTDEAVLERRVVRCSIRLESEWLLDDCHVTKATPIRE